jgi:hypothetical protein
MERIESKNGENRTQKWRESKAKIEKIESKNGAKQKQRWRESKAKMERIESANERSGESKHRRAQCAKKRGTGKCLLTFENTSSCFHHFVENGENRKRMLRLDQGRAGKKKLSSNVECRDQN